MAVLEAHLRALFSEARRRYPAAEHAIWKLSIWRIFKFVLDYSFLNYNDTDANLNTHPLLIQVLTHNIPVSVFSGEQDIVVPLLASHTLGHDLAHDLNLKVDVP